MAHSLCVLHKAMSQLDKVFVCARNKNGNISVGPIIYTSEATGGVLLQAVSWSPWRPRILIYKVPDSPYFIAFLSLQQDRPQLYACWG